MIVLNSLRLVKRAAVRDFVFQARRFSIFTSSHFRLDATAVAAYLERRGLSFRETPTHCIVKTCPLCLKPHNDDTTNLFKLYVRKLDGAFFCHRCGKGGSFYDLKSSQGDVPQVVDASLGDVSRTPALSPVECAEPSPAADRSSELTLDYKARSPPLTADMRFVEAACDDLMSRRFPAVLDYLHTRGFSDAVLREYRVGAARRWFPFSDGRTGGSEHDVVVFPWLEITSPVSASVPVVNGGLHSSLPSDPADVTAPTFRCVRLKIRSISDKACQQMLPKGGKTAGLFGLHVLPVSPRCPAMASSPLPSVITPPARKRKGSTKVDGTAPPGVTSPSLSLSHSVEAETRVSEGVEVPTPIVVVTEGEFDALAVRQATGFAAVSLPNGCRSLPLEVLPLLEHLDRLHLWLDDDIPGREGVERISQKLGLGRCFIVQPTPGLLRKLDPAAAIGNIIGGSDSPKDANEALLRGYDLRALILGASVRRHDQIITFSDIRPAVMREVAAAFGGNSVAGDAAGGRFPHSGVPLRSLPRVSKLVKGLRSGELTIVTGATGAGKTTLLSQMSLDLCMQV
jgi:twinkle protein